MVPGTIRAQVYRRDTATLACPKGLVTGPVLGIQVRSLFSLQVAV